MDRIPLGRSGIDVSRVGLGCNNFGRRIDLDATRAVVDAALEAGVDFFDTANVYGRGTSERFLGELLQGRRDRVVLATKFGMDMGDGVEARGSRDYVRRAIDDSLERLRTDRVDLYYYHRPDGVTPLEETLGTLDELRREGKIRAVGISNFDAAQLVDAVEACDRNGWPRPAALQNEYSLLDRSPEPRILPLCREHGVGFVPYFPLASGLLTGKYRRDRPHPDGTRIEAGDERLDEATLDRVERIAAFAEERGLGLLDVAIGALASEPGVSGVIAGATKPEQVRANAAAAGVRISDADRDALRSL